MGASSLTVGWLVIIGAVGQTSAPAGAIKQDEIDYQVQMFEHWWGLELVQKFDDLPTEGEVPKFRIPYSGHDYPDRGGGTVAAMGAYDRAFNNGRSLATEYERKDVGSRKRLRDRSGRGVVTDYANSGRRGGFFTGLFGSRTPGWYGHCNGWTAAAIRHAEPQHSVTRNGVVFTPALIKGLLADIYMYTDTEFLGGVDAAINPGVLHLTFSNWLGRGSHPIGMETTLGEVAFNYPAYSFKSTNAKHSDNEVEVKMNVAYATSITYEAEKSPREHKVIYFHYVLSLDDDGNIVGGRYYGDSAQIDMLWNPLQPIQGGEEGNKRGNPHVDIKEVLSIWRESVPKELRDDWLNIDPTDEDRVADASDSEAEDATNESDESAPAEETPKEANGVSESE